MNILASNPLLQALKQELTPEKIKVKGVVKSTPYNYGFLIIENDNTTAFIPPPLMSKVLSGDEVEANIVKEDNEKAVVDSWTKLINTSVDVMCGRVKKVEIPHKNLTFYHFISDDAHDGKEYRIKAVAGESFQDGDWVKVSLSDHAYNRKFFYVEIKERIAHENDASLPWKYINSKFELNSTLNKFLGAETCYQKYENRTLWPYVTVDGEFSTDLDDAVYVVKKELSYVLHIAIADPSALFEGNQCELLSRAFSLYLPKDVAHMLPEALISQKYSLDEAQERPSLCADIEVCATTGEILGVVFVEALISSKEKLSYNGVAAFIESKEHGVHLFKDKVFAESLLNLKELSDIRLAHRKEKGVVFNSNDDIEFIFEGLTPVALKKHSQSISHVMIQEAAVMANEAFAMEAKRRDSNGIFNVHRGLKLEHEGEVKALLAELSIVIENNMSTVKGFVELNNALIAKEDELSLSNQEELKKIYQIKRFFYKTVFSSSSDIHAMLGMGAYGTWTSPLRKVGDMINHQVIKSWIHSTPALKIRDEWVDSISEVSLRNKNIYRTMERLLKIKLLQNSSSYIKYGIISYISKKEIKLKIEALDMDVLMPINSLGRKASGNVPSQEVHKDGQVIFQLGDVVAIHLDKIDLLYQKAFVSKLG